MVPGTRCLRQFFCPNLTTINYNYTGDLFIAARCVLYAKGQFCCRFDSRLKFRGLKEMEHKNWVTKDENIWKPQIR